MGKPSAKYGFAIWAAQMDAHRADCAQIAKSKLRMVFDQTRDKYKTELEQDRIEVLYEWLARCNGAISPLVVRQRGPMHNMVWAGLQ